MGSSSGRGPVLGHLLAPVEWFGFGLGSVDAPIDIQCIGGDHRRRVTAVAGNPPRTATSVAFSDRGRLVDDHEFAHACQRGVAGQREAVEQRRYVDDGFGRVRAGGVESTVEQLSQSER